MRKLFLSLLFVLLATSVASANVLTWTDNSSVEDGFAVEMLQGGTWGEVGRVGSNITTFSDANTEGVYRVRAYLNLPDGTTVFSLYSNTAAKLNAPVNATVK